MKKTYIVPALTVVEFALERGYVASSLSPQMVANEINLFLADQAEMGQHESMEGYDVQGDWGGYTNNTSDDPSQGYWRQGDNHFWD